MRVCDKKGSFYAMPQTGQNNELTLIFETCLEIYLKETVMGEEGGGGAIFKPF